MTAPSAFDLIHESWIRVRTLDGVVEERSLRATLAEAQSLRGLAGELPTQDVAVLRLLLAVILGATRPRHQRTEDECFDLFSAWWARGALPMSVLDPYLERISDRFDLLHPKTPFMQVADLTTSTGKRTGLGKLIADLPANHWFFTTRGAAATESMGLPEAARWLVLCLFVVRLKMKAAVPSHVSVKGG